jgi:hypothetical protein
MVLVSNISHGTNYGLVPVLFFLQKWDIKVICKVKRLGGREQPVSA